MNRAVFLVIVAVFLLYGFSALAADKVVVVPLGSSSAKGTDGQVQYNDNGKTAGAELYYDKSSSRLESRGEVRTTDSLGTPRLWGRGRPGTGLMSHTGACPNLLAKKRFALSKHMVTWEGAAEACPINTWVCTSADLPTVGTCSVPSASYDNYRLCDGTLNTEVTDILFGWLADAHVNLSDVGLTVASNNLPVRLPGESCQRLRVWCCWNSSVTLPPF